MRGEVFFAGDEIACIARNAESRQRTVVIKDRKQGVAVDTF